MPDFDPSRFRLRALVEHLTELGEVEMHDEPVPLVDLSGIIESSDRAVLFRNAGPEKLELVAGVAGRRSRLAAALGVEVGELAQEYERRMAEPRHSYEVPSSAAPVHEVVLTGSEVDLAALPFYLQHEHDGGPYISSAIDYSVDPATGKRNVGCRRLMLRSRQTLRSNLSQPSDLQRAYKACVARGETLPVSFAVGSYPTDYLAASLRLPGDEFELVARLRGAPLPMVRGRTNGVPAPADAEMVIEGYFDELGYREDEGPYGEFWGYYGPVHIDPVFHVTAVTMRRDMLHQSVVHGHRAMARMELGPMAGILTEASLYRTLRAVGIEPAAVHANEAAAPRQQVRIALSDSSAGQARAAISAVFAMRGMKHVTVLDKDIDVTSDAEVAWALSTRFHAADDLVVGEGFPAYYADPTARGGLVTKVGFDATTGVVGEEISTWRPQAPLVTRRDRTSDVASALADGPLYFRELCDAVGSDDGREIALELDELRERGALTRTPNGRWSLAGDG